MTAPATAGAYHYGACVDAVADESDTTDNCSSSVAVTVTGAAEESDSSALALASLQVSGGASTMYPDFAGDILHYALACEDPDTIQVSARSARSGARLTLLRAAAGDNQTAIGTLDVQVTVDDDHDLAIELTDDGESVTYVVHCIPADFPDIKILQRTDDVSDGLLFVTPTYRNPTVSYMAILDNNGVPRFQRKISGHARNFRPYESGPLVADTRVRYSVTVSSSQVLTHLLDANLDTIRSVQAVSPLPPADTNFHDFLIMEDGTRLFIVYYQTTRDLCTAPDSCPTAFTDSVIQEVTAQGIQRFQWNSWDHLNRQNCPDFDSGNYAHLNSLHVTDGDVIASIRRCSQVLRLDRSSGTWNVQWQLGGVFPPRDSDTATLSIVGDRAGEFCGQHHATVTSSGSLLLFDNGNLCHGPRKNRQRFSRVVEYDVSSGTQATFVAEYRRPAGHGHTNTQGAVTLLDNGHWLISWGSTDGNTVGVDEIVAISEVKGTGSRKTSVFELHMSKSGRLATSYRVYRESQADVEIPLNLP